MNYLIVNHIPAHAGRDAAHWVLPRAWARDVAAAARAATERGVRLTVATPTTDAPPPADAVELVPDAAGFEHAPLPRYDSPRTFLRVRGDVSARLAELVAAADVVQLDHGGHPVPLGLLADPVARAAGRPTIWIASADRRLVARMADASRSTAKRAVGRTLDGRVRRTMLDALRRAAHVVTAGQASADTLRDRDGIAAHAIEAIDATDAEVIDAATLARRHAALLDASRPLRLVVLGEQTIDRGTEHVLAAMHRCWRLRAAVHLVTSARGGEADAVRRHAAELGLSAAVTFADAPDPADADVLVDAALCNRSRQDLDAHVAAGRAPIAYAPRRACAAVVGLPRGAVDALADAIFSAATDRAALASRVLAGVAWARERTLDASHRRRIALALDAAACTVRGAA